MLKVRKQNLKKNDELITANPKIRKTSPENPRNYSAFRGTNQCFNIPIQYVSDSETLCLQTLQLLRTLFFRPLTGASFLDPHWGTFSVKML